MDEEMSKVLCTDEDPDLPGARILSNRLGIKLPAARIDEYFRQHLRGDLHFVALGKEDREEGIRVDLLAPSEDIASAVLSAFNWHASADLTY